MAMQAVFELDVAQRSKEVKLSVQRCAKVFRFTLWHSNSPRFQTSSTSPASTRVLINDSYILVFRKNALCSLFIQCMKFLELTKDGRVLNCNLNMAVLSSLWLTSWNRPRPSSRHPHLSRSCTRSRVPSNLSCSKARMIMPNALFSVSTGIIPLKSLTPLSMRTALLCVVLRWTYLLLVQHPLYVRFETFYPGHHSLSYPVHATLMSILLPWEKYLS